MRVVKTVDYLAAPTASLMVALRVDKRVNYVVDMKVGLTEYSMESIEVDLMADYLVDWSAVCLVDRWEFY